MVSNAELTLFQAIEPEQREEVLHDVCYVAEDEDVRPCSHAEAQPVGSRDGYPYQYTENQRTRS